MSSTEEKTASMSN